MAENISTVGTGKDYTTLTAWEAAETVSSDTPVAEVYNEEFDERVTFNDGSADATYYRIVRPASGEGITDGDLTATDNGPLWHPQEAGHVFTVDEKFLHIEGIRLRTYSSGGSSDECIRVGDSGENCEGLTVERCFFRYTGSGSATDGIYGGNYQVGTASNPITVKNCVFDGFDRAGVHAQLYSGTATQYWLVVNCTFTRCDYGVGYGTQDSGATAVIKAVNLLIGDTNNKDFGSTGNHNGTLTTTGSATNFDERGEVPDGTTVTFTNTDPGASGTYAWFESLYTDWTLVDDANNDVIDQGSGTSDDSDVPSTDFFGAARGSTETSPGAILPPDTGASSGSGTPSVERVTSSGAAEAHRAGTGAANLERLSSAGVAEAHRAATGAADVPRVSSAGAAEAHRSASGAASVQRLTSSGAALSAGPEGVGAADLPRLTGGGTAEAHRAGAGAADLPRLTASGAATYVGANRTGSGTPSLPRVSSSGAAKAHRSAVGAANIQRVECFGISGEEAVPTVRSFILTQGSAPSGVRVTDGLRVLYTFDSSAGGLIPDVSGVAPPLDLTVEDLPGLVQQAGYVTIQGSGTRIYAENAVKINQSVIDSNELTVELWCAPRDLQLHGPARMLSLSDPSAPTSSRNFMVGQGGNNSGAPDDGRVSIRTRTSEGQAQNIQYWQDGAPYLFTDTDLFVAGELTHLVVTYTYDVGANAAFRKIYKNSLLFAEDVVEGEFSNWGAAFDLNIADEDDSQEPARNWFGDLHLVAVYDRGLSAAEVELNYFAGADVSGTVPPATVEFAEASYSVGESGGVVVVGVQLASPRNYPITIPLAFAPSGSPGAVKDTDYSVSTETLVLAAGEIGGSVTVTGINVDGVQGDRDFAIMFTGLNGEEVVPGAVSSTTVTVIEAEVIPTVAFEAPTSSVQEGQTRQVRVRLSNPYVSEVRVDFADTGGSASSPADYTVVTQSPLVFPAGTEIATIDVSTVDDGVPEGSETVNLQLSNPTVGSITQGSHALTIQDAAGFPLVTQGSGWTAPTGEPARYGSGVGSNNRPCARFDVVPDQDFTADFTIGVVAFHINGIDRVEYSADDGPWVSSTQMLLNPRTGVWEYGCTLDSSTFSDGPTEIRARVYPASPSNNGSPGSGGQPRVLSVLLYCNAGGSLPSTVVYASGSGSDGGGNGTQGSPYRTIQRAANHIAGQQSNASGGIIRLLPGVYDLPDHDAAGGAQPSTPDRYLTVEGDPGQPNNQARITGSDYRFAPRLHLKNLEITTTTTIHSSFVSVWGDNLRMNKTGVSSVPCETGPCDYNGDIFRQGASGYKDIYLTDCEEYDIGSGAGYVSLRRGGLIHDLGKDGIYNFDGLCVNTVVHTLRGVANYHPDMVQMQGPERKNIIMFNTRVYDAAGQGFFMKDPEGFVTDNEDWAVVNCSFDLPAPENFMYGGPYVSGMKRGVDHFLIWHVTGMGWSENADNQAQGQRLQFDEADYPVNLPTVFNNVSVRNCALHSLGGGGNADMLDSNHYFFPDPPGAGTDTRGTNHTEGSTPDAQFVDAEVRPISDLHPKPGSPLRNSAPLIVPCDAEGAPRLGPNVSRGAFE